MVILALLLACREPEPDPIEVPAPDPLDPVALLTRMSLDVRGRRPSEEEILRVEADPDAIDDLADELLADPAWGERLVALYADEWRTRADKYVVGADGDADLLDPAGRARFMRAVGEEPLRVIERVATDDRPWTDLVTADWTMTQDLLASKWPVEPIEEGHGWRMGRYSDARPAAGILATNGLWWRYTTTIQNANRGRAETVARHLLCDERFDQPVQFRTSTDDLDRLELVERISTDPACISCHVMLDPMASYLFGFYRNHPESYSEAAWYYPTREDWWVPFTGVAPGYYGEPGETLYDLGQQIAGDPRFVTCAVEQTFGFLYDRPAELDDTDALEAHRQDFLDGGLTARALWRSVLASEGYRSADEDVPGTVPLRRVQPDQLATSVEALTGFRWTFEGVDLFVNDTFGVRVLAGGADGLVVTQPATAHATTTALVQERLAEAAADYAVTRELELDPADRTLLREVDPAADLDDAALIAQVQALVLRAHGRRAPADDPDVVALAALWRDSAGRQSPDAAWRVVLSAILRHPDFLHY